MFCPRTILLFTLHALLNAIICCSQLNTGRGADANLKVDYLDTDACWMAVCVLCRNAQVNLIVIIMTCMCIVMPSLFVNCPTVICSPNMLFLIGETPLVNYGPRSILLHLKYNLLQSLFSAVLCKQTSFSTPYV